MVLEEKSSMQVGLITWAILLVLASNVSAQHVFTGLLNNSNPLDVSSVSAQCERSSDGQQMTCNFVQVRVDLVQKPEAAAAELEKQLQEATPQEMAKACKDLRKDIADLDAKTAATKNVAPRLKAFFTSSMQRFNAMCDKPTIQSIRDYLWHTLEKDTKTCRIWTNPWKETFIKQLRNKWVSNQGPNGICGAVLVSTLSTRIDPKNPDSPSSLWTYETQKVVTNKDVDSDFCQIDETKVRFSWDAKDFDKRPLRNIYNNLA